MYTYYMENPDFPDKKRNLLLSWNQKKENDTAGEQKKQRYIIYSPVAHNRVLYFGQIELFDI